MSESRDPRSLLESVNGNREYRYGLGELRGAVSRARAIELFIGACNKPDTLFITDSWFASREEKLRELLSDPVNSEEAEALLDVVLKRRPMEHLLDHFIEWLEHARDIPWPEFINHQLGVA